MAFDFEAAFSIGVAIGDKLDNIHKALAKEDPKPLFIEMIKGASGPGAVNLGSPPEGKMWNILSLMVTGGDDHTAVTGTAALYVDSHDDALTVAQCKIPNISMPYSNFISKGTLWAHSTGNVVVNLVGVTAGQQITVNMGVAEWRVKDTVQTYV